MNFKKLFTPIALLGLAFFSQSSVAGGSDHRVTLDIPGMQNCGNCPPIIFQALMHVPGVKYVENDMMRQQTLIIFDTEQTSVDTMQQALKEVGFKSTVKMIETY